MNAPLTDRDYAEIRARVHVQLARERRQRVAWRVGAAAAILAGALLLRTPRLTAPEATPRGTTASFPEAPARAVPSALPAAATGVTLSDEARTAAATSLETPRRPPQTGARSVATVKHRPSRKTHPQPQPLRLEIETADPDVRIIWFINPSTEETL